MKINKFSSKSFTLLFIILIGFSSCLDKGSENSSSSKVTYESIDWDLKDIKKLGKIRALTVYSATTYFLYKGRPMGYEYELLKRFAEHLGLELELIVVQNIDELFEKLNNGEGDIIAHGLTITKERKKEVAFTDYLYLTKQVLVQKKPDNWRTMHWHKLENAMVHDAIELLNDTVHIRANSAYKERIQNLSEELGGPIHIKELPGELSTDQIIQNVAQGEYEYTISDYNIASIMEANFPVLDISVPVSFSQRIAWVTRLSSPDLLKATNKWLKTMKRKVDYNVIYNKYFKNKKAFRSRAKSQFYSLNKNQISPYDKILKNYSKTLNWDWLLLTSQVYQESRFDPKDKSWANAEGLMQIMPATAKDLGVTDPTDPEQSIRGGTKYLKQIWSNFEKVTDSIQRIKFTLASYNCGLYHVIDAQRLALKKGLDPEKWDDNVELMILELSKPKMYNDPVVKYGYVRGIEPYNYVIQIFERYELYKQVINT
ncbi:transporter substrate-binding domain-containing protein [Gaetbulibacter sp. M240]|uniref:transporter substrate-binding domain-containing protein n=1 Tax=Gaetbulibacter sp. M240 TaxID=3126511 RepID=UPI00374FADBC